MSSFDAICVCACGSGGDESAGWGWDWAGWGWRGPAARALRPPRIFSGLVPRRNGSGLSGFGARSRVALRRSRSDSSALGRGGAVLSTSGITSTNRNGS